MKKLIYFTLGNNSNYINLAKLCIESLNRINYDGDFLFITNFKETISQNISFKNNVHFMEVPNEGLYFSSANKLKLYKFDKINEYDKILFSDLDILFTGDVNLIYDEINDDKFYVSNENELMSEEWWGARILSLEEKKIVSENKIMGINAGFFAFNKNMVNYLQEIDIFLSKNIHLSNDCLEQPFFNVFLFRNSLYNNILNKYVTHNGYQIDEFNGVAVHFAGGPGNYQVKHEKMNLFFKKNIL